MFILALLLILLFFGLGFAAKILWWGIILGLILMVASWFSGPPAGPGGRRWYGGWW